jgi:hypothetical protein
VKLADVVASKRNAESDAHELLRELHALAGSTPTMWTGIRLLSGKVNRIASDIIRYQKLETQLRREHLDAEARVLFPD